MASYVARRKFLATLGGAAATWPLAARARQGERMRRIGVLLPAAPDDAEFQSWVGASLQGLAQSGWITGRNIRIETRWTKFDPDETRKYAAELVALAPDVILATGNSTVRPLLRLTRTVPIVFPLAADPVASGLVESLARPGGNVTGFMSFEVGFSAKWLELLKEIAPGIKRAVCFERLLQRPDPANSARSRRWRRRSDNLTGINIFAAELVAKRLQLLREMVPAAARVAVLVDPASTTITEATLRDVEPAARAMGMQIQVLHASNRREINAAFATFLRKRPDALFVSIGPLFAARRVQLATLAARHMVPMTSGNRQNTEIGGLMSYGANIVDAYHQMGVYVGRILKGEKPADKSTLSRHGGPRRQNRA